MAQVVVFRTYTSIWAISCAFLITWSQFFGWKRLLKIYVPNAELYVIIGTVISRVNPDWLQLYFSGMVSPGFKGIDDWANLPWRRPVCHSKIAVGVIKMAYKKSQETKQKILEATEAVVLRKGYVDASISDIAEEINIPRTLVYYYYPNKELIMDELSDIIYHRTLHEADKHVDPEQDPILNLLLKYILLFEHIVLNDITREYFLTYGPYVVRGPEKIKQARKECYPHIESVFRHYNLPVTEANMNLYVITSDAMIKALFTGIVNGTLDITLKEALNYFGRHVVLPSFQISGENYESMVDHAFEIANGITISHSIVKNEIEDQNEDIPYKE